MKNFRLNLDDIKLPADNNVLKCLFIRFFRDILSNSNDYHFE